MRGNLFVLSGGEGAGKTTCLELLKTRLPEGKFHFTREPGGTDFAEMLRTIFKTEFETAPDEFEQLLLVEAGRSHHVRTRMKPVLERGIHIVCDRFYESTIAYQCRKSKTHGEKVRQLFYALNDMATGGLKPNLFIHFELPLDVALERIANRPRKVGYNPFDDITAKEHTEIWHALHEFVRFTNHVNVDATLPLEELADEVARIIISFNGV